MLVISNLVLFVGYLVRVVDALKQQFSCHLKTLHGILFFGNFRIAFFYASRLRALYLIRHGGRTVWNQKKNWELWICFYIFPYPHLFSFARISAWYLCVSIDCALKFHMDSLRGSDTALRAIPRTLLEFSKITTWTKEQRTKTAPTTITYSFGAMERSVEDLRTPVRLCAWFNIEKRCVGKSAFWRHDNWPH